MNEQLIVKNFGPIKDATVDFKRVTVFIGPTGGGKSTLAKLELLFRNEINNKLAHDKNTNNTIFKQYGLNKFFRKETSLSSSLGNHENVEINKNPFLLKFSTVSSPESHYTTHYIELLRKEMDDIQESYIIASSSSARFNSSEDRKSVLHNLNENYQLLNHYSLMHSNDLFRYYKMIIIILEPSIYLLKEYSFPLSIILGLGLCAMI